MNYVQSVTALRYVKYATTGVFLGLYPYTEILGQRELLYWHILRSEDQQKFQ